MKNITLTVTVIALAVMASFAHAEYPLNAQMQLALGSDDATAYRTTVTYETEKVSLGKRSTSIKKNHFGTSAGCASGQKFAGMCKTTTTTCDYYQIVRTKFVDYTPTARKVIKTGKENCKTASPERKKRPVYWK